MSAEHYIMAILICVILFVLTVFLKRKGKRYEITLLLIPIFIGSTLTNELTINEWYYRVLLTLGVSFVILFVLVLVVRLIPNKHTK